MHIPLIEKLKSIPGALGIRLEQELPYKVIRSSPKLELREYTPFTLARVSHRGDFETAKEACFKQLAEFIYGENTQHDVLAMTTPVFYDQKDDVWIMSFYLPDEVADTTPENGNIKIEKKKGKTVAALRFSGNFELESMNHARRELLEVVNAQDLRPVSEVWWAQFDQPFSVPMTKRNEALVVVTQHS